VWEGEEKDRARARVKGKIERESARECQGGVGGRGLASVCVRERE